MMLYVIIQHHQFIVYAVMDSCHRVLSYGLEKRA